MTTLLLILLAVFAIVGAVQHGRPGRFWIMAFVVALIIHACGK